MDAFGTEGFFSRRMIAMAILVIVAAIGLILWFRHRTPKEVLTIGPYNIGPNTDRKDQPKWIPMLTAEQIAKTTTNNITCSFFLYVDTDILHQLPVNYDGSYNLEYVMKVGRTMGITVNPVKQECIVDILQADPHTHRGSTVRARTNAIRTIRIPNFYLAKWNQITITVEGRSIDTYLNGKLATSAILDNVPITLFSGMDLNGSPDFNAQVSLVQVWPTRRSSQQILENYKANTDTRGKPIVPEPTLSFSGALGRLSTVLCTGTGICGFILQTSPTDYVEYDFA